MILVPFELNDTLILKKDHPCRNNAFRVLRKGSDIRIICTKCGRDLTLPREKLEKMIKKVLPIASADEK